MNRNSVRNESRLRRKRLTLLLSPLLLAGFLASFVAVASPASAAIPGLQRVTATSILSSSSKSVTATCPSPKKVIGTGFRILHGSNASKGQIVVDEIVSTLSSVFVVAYEDQDGTTETWQLQAHAVCANPLPGLELRPAASVWDSSTTKTVTATCSPGKKLLGTGADIAGGYGQVVLDDITPHASLTSVSVRAWEDDDGMSSAWFVRAYAICAFPVAGQELRTASSSYDSFGSKLLSATCSPGRVLLGTAADIGNGVGHVMLDFIIPNSNSASALAYEDLDGTSATWNLRAHAICATP